MNWTAILVLVLLVGYIVSETVGPTLTEGFAVPRRSDVGLTSDGWREEAGFQRDLRYAEGFVDIQGFGLAADFCRAVYQNGDPESLQIACAMATRDGMDPLEYRSRTKRDGFRFSRDDYWRGADYCRIVRDEETGEWYSTCAIAGRTGFKTQEERDTSPPPAIRQLLEGYDGAMAWFRWFDDTEDYTGNMVFETHGRPEVPTLLKPYVSRGVQLRGDDDYLRWGERGTLEITNPREIRAVAFWIYWDSVTTGRIVECSNGRKDRFWIGVEGAAESPLAPAIARPAQELSPQALLAVGPQLTEPQLTGLTHKMPSDTKPAYAMEIWDGEQRIMRLTSPAASATAGQWQHVVLTTTDSTSWWPTWELWIDGELVAIKADGRLSPALEWKQNFLGRGVRGCLQDFRVYTKPMGPAKIRATVAWGRGRLHPQP